MKILVIEDDDYKAESISALSREVFGDASIEITESLFGAIDAISRDKFDILLVDMSIPSHPKRKGEGNAVSLLTGGMDVILRVRSLGYGANCIVITQYPDVEISGHFVPIKDVKKFFSESLECDIDACLLYSEDEEGWRRELVGVLTKIKDEKNENINS